MELKNDIDESRFKTVNEIEKNIFTPNILQLKLLKKITYIDQEIRKIYCYF